MKRRDLLPCVGMFVVSVAILAVIHHAGDPTWFKEHLLASPGTDGILWQVQTTLLSVGLAGLAIAAQLFAESPLAIGASRGRVLEYVRVGWFVAVGLVGNAVIAVEAIWLPSNVGVVGVAVVWFAPTVLLLGMATSRLARLFGHPSLLDEVAGTALARTMADRLAAGSKKYSDAQRQLEGLFDSGFDIGPSAVTMRVPVPRAGLVIKAIKPQTVRRAIASLGPSVTATTGDGGANELFTPVRISLNVEPGDRTRFGETAFRVSTPPAMEQAARDRFVRLLQSSIEFEAPESVTPDEETDREIASLKDAIGTSLRTGAFGTAERALKLLGEVVRGVWTAPSEGLDSSRRSSFARQDWVYRSIGEVEQDALLSRRACALFISHAMTRAIEASRTGSTEYVDESLRSLARLWSDVLRNGTSEFDLVPARITTCVQNLAAYSFATADPADDFQARATWAMVELVKLALDAHKPEAAKLAARELSGLFEHLDRGASLRVHVRGGQLVLSGWLNYLSEKRDSRDPADPGLLKLVEARGTWAEILNARSLAERGAAPFSRWDWWEVETSGSGQAQVLELSTYIDLAELAALASTHGSLPPASDQETASEYRRFERLLGEGNRELSVRESNLKEKLVAELAKWDAAESERLAQAPVSEAQVDRLRAAIREAVDARQRLASQVPVAEVVPDTADASRPILGMNFRVPRHYLVEEVFNNTYADPKELGRMIGQAFADGEDLRILGQLRLLQSDVLPSSAQAIRRQIETLGEEAQHWALVTPYGGLMDIDEWYSMEFRAALNRVIHLETAALADEAVLFDRRNTLTSCRRPEDKDGLARVEGTSIALGVFEDVPGGDEPQVRIETGEYFVVWPTRTSRVFWFGTKPDKDGERGREEDPIGVR